MSRVQYVEPELAGAEVRHIYDEKLQGRPANVQKALANRPELLSAFLQFSASVGRSLDRRLFELLYLRVSFLNNCRYCLQHHWGAAKRGGLTREDFDAVRQGENSTRFDPKERLALRLAETLTRTPTSNAGNEAEALKGRFSDDQIVDIVATIALANLTNRLADGLGLELDITEEASDLLP